MTPDIPVRRAEDVISVDRVDPIGAESHAVRLQLDGPESDIEVTMVPESALWLAIELWRASGLDLNHNFRFRRRRPEGEQQS